MSNLPLELVCPKCGIDVQPIKAAGCWFCPHCAWQFAEEDIERARRQAEDGDHPPAGNPP